MTEELRVIDRDLPGLYQSANHSSLDAQRTFFVGLACYLVVLVLATAVAFFGGGAPNTALLSAVLFLVSLAVLLVPA